MKSAVECKQCSKYSSRQDEFRGCLFNNTKMEKLIDWLRNKELLDNYGGICSHCDTEMVKLVNDDSFSKDGQCLTCSHRDCRKKTSVRRGSWFSKSHLSLEEIVKLTYYWVHKYPAELVKHKLTLGNEHTAVDWFKFAR